MVDPHIQSIMQNVLEDRDMIPQRMLREVMDLRVAIPISKRMLSECVRGLDWEAATIRINMVPTRVWRRRQPEPGTLIASEFVRAPFLEFT